MVCAFCVRIGMLFVSNRYHTKMAIQTAPALHYVCLTLSCELPLWISRATTARQQSPQYAAQDLRCEVCMATNSRFR